MQWTTISTLRTIDDKVDETGGKKVGEEGNTRDARFLDFRIGQRKLCVLRRNHVPYVTSILNVVHFLKEAEV